MTNYHLVKNLKKAELISNRDGFGEGLLDLGKKNSRVVVLSADLTESTRAHLFAKEFPSRFFEMGITEQAMMGAGAGFALSGKIPFLCSYAAFNPGRNWDHFRVSVCYNDVNVKVVGGHAGLSVGPDGATHQALEDIAITRVLPKLTVVVPCDAEQAKKATIAIGKHEGPCYLRLCRAKTSVITTAQTPFEIGKAQEFETGSDVVIIATGIMVAESLIAASLLKKKKISCTVINMHTIKPLDVNAIISAAKKCGAVVTVEEHQKVGGLGSAVSEVLVEHYPVPLERVGVSDTFGESGDVKGLLKKYGLTSSDIVAAVKKVIGRKKKK